MKCRRCGGDMEERVTDLPFKVAETTIAIIKGLPVFLCPECGEYELTDSVMGRVDGILRSVDHGAELQVLRYAA